MFCKIRTYNKIGRHYAAGVNSTLCRFRKWPVGRSASCIMMIIGFALTISMVTHAGTLDGQVLGQKNQPAFNVNVDILGPVTVFTQTDKDGKFLVTIPAGAYVIRVRDGGRRMEFSRNITEETQKEIFRLAW